MTIKLNKTQFFLTFSLLFVLMVFTNRIHFYIRSSFATGVLINKADCYPNSMISTSYIEFLPINEEVKVRFQGVSNLKIADCENIPVIYKTSNPSKAYVYTRYGFWIGPIMYFLLIFIFVCAITYAFLDENRRYVFRFFQNQKKVFTTEIVDYKKH